MSYLTVTLFVLILLTKALYGFWNKYIWWTVLFICTALSRYPILT
jgi:hypothetical protein